MECVMLTSAILRFLYLLSIKYYSACIKYQTCADDIQFSKIQQHGKCNWIKILLSVIELKLI